MWTTSHISHDYRISSPNANLPMLCSNALHLCLSQLPQLYFIFISLSHLQLPSSSVCDLYSQHYFDILWHVSPPTKKKKKGIRTKYGQPNAYPHTSFENWNRLSQKRKKPKTSTSAYLVNFEPQSSRYVPIDIDLQIRIPPNRLVSM